MQQPQGSAKLQSLLSLRSWGPACALTLGEGSRHVLPWCSPPPPRGWQSGCGPAGLRRRGREGLFRERAQSPESPAVSPLMSL